MVLLLSKNSYFEKTAYFYKKKMLDKSFQQAKRDYSYLLERVYSPGNILMLVSDHYGLTGVQRTMLYRGVSPNEENLRRIKKPVDEEFCRRKPLFIDGFNVLITIASYLQGLPVFLATDGFLRDASHTRGKIEAITCFEPAIGLLLKYLSEISPLKATIFLDLKVGIHRTISGKITELANHENCSVDILINDDVDNTLISMETGIVCTSDSIIIDRTQAKVFDLARNLLVKYFKPDFLDLGLISP
jgi:hypothetical protein